MGTQLILPTAAAGPGFTRALGEALSETGGHIGALLMLMGPKPLGVAFLPFLRR